MPFIFTVHANNAQPNSSHVSLGNRLIAKWGGQGQNNIRNLDMLFSVQQGQSRKQRIKKPSVRVGEKVGLHFLFCFVDGAKGKGIKNENLSKWKEFAQNIQTKGANYHFLENLEKTRLRISTDSPHSSKRNYNPPAEEKGLRSSKKINIYNSFLDVNLRNIKLESIQPFIT